MDRSTFFKHLRRSRLLSREEVEALADRLPADAEGPALARLLVSEKVLTEFQARQLLAGKSNRLVLGQYQILDRLGRGGMGQVFKAVHPAMGRIVALKVMLPDLLKDPSALDLFQREVRTAAQLQHPNIVTAYDAAQARGVHFLVTEYVRGVSLDELIRRMGPLPVPLACELMRQAGVALQYAHEKGVVHRDIKPANFLVTTREAAQIDERGSAASLPALSGTATPILKVLDFGIARLRSAGKATAEDTIRAQSGSVVGTLDYISPEQANNVHDVDIRSDLYSLGCTFYHVLTGEPPFPTGTPMEILIKHLMHEPRPLNEVRPDVPLALAKAVQRLMAKTRNRRFQTPSEFVTAVATWCGAQSAPESAPVVAPPREAAPAPIPVPAPAPIPVPQADPEHVPTAPSVPQLQATDMPLPEPTPNRLPIDAGFRARWQQWTALVEVSALRRGTHHWVDPEAFRVLQEELVRTCHVHAHATTGELRDFYVRLEALVRPWVTPDSLMQTDRKIHLDLVRLCQQAEQEIDRLTGQGRAETVESRTTLWGFLSRFRGRRERQQFEEEMRRRFGVQL